MLTALRKSFAKYRAFFIIGAAERANNYKLLLGLSFFMLACLWVFAFLWDATSSRTGTPIFTPAQLLWYLALNEWLIISVPELEIDVEQDLRSGRLAYQLTRPVSYLGSKIAGGLGALLVQLFVLGIVAFTFCWLWTGGCPCSPTVFILSIILGVGAGILALIIQTTIGLSAFWFQEVGPIHWIVQKLLFVFGGLFLPLAAYPLWLQNIAIWTPFSALLGGRSAVLVNPEIQSILFIVASISAWLLLCTLFMKFLYKKGLKIITIEGG